MASALARAAGVDAQSAGLHAFPGAPASPQAIRAARLYGADLTGHRARMLDEAMLRDAEEVWVMTEAHEAVLNMMFPQYSRKVSVLWPPIPDPYGGGDRAYEKCAQSLREAMQRAGILAKS
jgi:protein-tyrosine-phosphatase